MISEEIYKYTDGYRPQAGRYRTSQQVFKERLDRARNQERLRPKSKDEIISCAKEFLEKYGFDNPECIEVKASPFLKSREKKKRYDEIKEQYHLFNSSHLIWMKFARKGNKVHLGVVAAGADINFDLNNISGRIISNLGYSWETDSVLICPLPHIGDKQRYDIERGLGNYLIKELKVPILDFFSHRY